MEYAARQLDRRRGVEHDPARGGRILRLSGTSRDDLARRVFGQRTNALSPQQLLGLTPRYALGRLAIRHADTTTPARACRRKPTGSTPRSTSCASAPTLTGSGQREANPVTPTQIERARFVLTAHSVAPETTLLGEPRIAIWPVADSTHDHAAHHRDRPRRSPTPPRSGTQRSYFFQRNNALRRTDDFEPGRLVRVSNAQLFNDLVARGSVRCPATAPPSRTKYPGAQWTQLMLEIVDFIRGLNAVDPERAAPFVALSPRAMRRGVGRGFVDPLTTTYGTARARSRCAARPLPDALQPHARLLRLRIRFQRTATTSSITTTTPDDAAGTSWKANFAVDSPRNRWSNVTSELRPRLRRAVHVPARLRLSGSERRVHIQITRPQRHQRDAAARHRQFRFRRNGALRACSATR